MICNIDGCQRKGEIIAYLGTMPIIYCKEHLKLGKSIIQKMKQNLIHRKRKGAGFIANLAPI